MRSLFPCLPLLILFSLAQAEKLSVFIGTGSKDAKGIYQCTFDTETGK